MHAAIANNRAGQAAFEMPSRAGVKPAGAFRAAEAPIPHGIFFLFGLGVFLSVKLVGYVTLAELMAAVIALMLASQGRLKNFGREMRWLLVAGGVWAVSAVGTDLYRGVEVALMARGTGRLIVFLLMLVCFYALIRARPSGLNWLLAGMCVSSVINVFAFRTGEAEFQVMTGESMQTSWERNYAMVTLMGALWLAAWLFERKPMLTAALVAVLGCVNIFEGSRNMGATLLVAALAAGSFRMMAGAMGEQRVRGGWFALKSALLVVVIAGAIYGGYKLAAAHGILGEAARVKYQSQVAGRFGVLLTSRIDFVAGLLAVRQSPIIGYGSWAQDDAGFMGQAYELAEMPFNSRGSTMYSFYNRIPTHSALLEAWVEHGLLAVSFWLCVLVILARAYFRGAMMDRRWGLFAGFVIAWIGWNILFSPFGGRGIYAVAVAFLVLYCEAASRRKAST